MSSIGEQFISTDYGQTNIDFSSTFNYSFDLYEYREALTPYGIIETRPPDVSTITIEDFTDGTHFRTGPESGTNHLQLELEDRLLTMIIDESGSMTWNDNNGDRYTYAKKLLNKLQNTYPGDITTNLLTFGGSLTKTTLFVAPSGADFLQDDDQSFDQLIQSSFQDSVYDFAGIRVVRRTDRFPMHPADGVIVAEGILEAVKDEGLTEGQTYYYGVWTFNKDKHFSPSGRFVTGVPYDRILPDGVNFANAITRVLPGVERGINSALIYNFVEGSGSITFDSSGNGLHGVLGSEVVGDNFWSGSTSPQDGTTRYKPVGVNFDGEYDIIETDISDTDDFVQDLERITINFWINPNNIDDTARWIIGTSTEEASNDIGWMVGTQGNEIVWQSSDLSSGVRSWAPPVTIPENEWTMVTLRWAGIAADSDYVIIYINGEEVSIASELTDILKSGMDRLYIGGKPISSAAVWDGGDYFGAIAQVSVHNVDMGEDWIAELYIQERPIFYQTYTSAAQTPPDNGQREVLLNWEIGTDYNYENGQVKIVRNYNSLPSHDEDDVIATIDASPGEFFYLDTADLTHGGDYYYRIFTVNFMGNKCDRQEARALAISVPYSVTKLNETPVPELPVVSGESVTQGNKKLLLQWSNPVDERWVGTKVFYSPDEFPTVSVSRNGITSSGIEIVDTTEEFYTHRILGQSRGGDVPLANGHIHYYTLVTYDQYGRLSERRLLQGVPSALSDDVFNSDEVNDLHLTVINPNALSVQWDNPTLSTEKLELYFGESAIIFVNVRDIFGAALNDLDNMNIDVCTRFETNSIIASSRSLGNDRNGQPGLGSGLDSTGGSGTTFPSGNCFSPKEAEDETVLSYAAVESGLVKGLLTHTLDRRTLSRRKSYTMSLRASYTVADPDDPTEELFQYVTPSTTVEFQNPIKMALINKLNKKAAVTPGANGEIAGEVACACLDNEGSESPRTISYDGGYINASEPYIARCELQYKGEAIPAGTPVSVSLWSHRDVDDDEFLQVKSDRTFINEGTYSTQTVFEEQLDFQGNPTGDVVSKSVVDIEITHPSEPDWVDVKVALDYLGFLVNGVHSARFIGTLFISADITRPIENGIDFAEQFATVWSLDPDFPQDTSKAVPAPDGTVVKWELIKGQYGKERPFYSTEEIPNAVNGVFSTTRNGVARNVFFGPVGNIEAHEEIKQCGEGSPPEECCIGEEYTIKASVILGDQTAFDGMIFNYTCDIRKFTDKRFYINAAPNQPGSDPHWVTWGDGESLLKFQIASNPVEIEADPELDMLKVSEYNDCVDSIVGGQNFALPEGHIVQVTAPGEIMWDVSFDEDPNTGELTPVSFQSISPEMAKNLGVPHVANIPLRGTITDFYVRYNTFVGNANPKPTECTDAGGDVDLLNCQYRNICASDENDIGERWDNVGTMAGSATLIVDNKQVTLNAGGDYEDGIFPIKIGFKEPLDVRIIEARDPSGEIVRELIVDGSTRLTFVCEVKFANKPVPDGTIVELNISGPGEEIVALSNCAGSPPGCNPVANGIIFTRQINDFRLNPEGAKRSLAFFTIEPISNVAFNARIDVTCRYDSLGTVDREITKCIELQNTINVTPGGDEGPSENEEEQALEERVTSNESIVYDTVQDLYESTTAAQIGRMGQFMVASSYSTVDEIYIMGGYTGLGQDIANEGDLSNANITPYAEVFNSVTQEWSFIPNMPTARCCGSAATEGRRIYCIGGIEKDVGPVDQYLVSRKIEAYDIQSGVWVDTLAPMPEGYGAAFSDAQVHNGYIYVVCGVTSIVDNSRPGELNDKILRYSIADDEWTIITPSDEEKYKRLAPMGFYRSNPQVSQTVTTEIIGSSDDSYDIFGSPNTIASFLLVGQTSSSIFEAHLRFQVDIPTNATITGAYLSGYHYDQFDPSGSYPVIQVGTAEEDDFGPFADLNNPGYLTYYYSSSLWSPSDVDQYINSPDISDTLRNWHSRAGYQPGNHVVFELSPQAPVNGESSEFRSVRYPGNVPFQLVITYIGVDESEQKQYVVSGSVPKSQSEIEAERNAEINRKLAQFRSFILTSEYFLNLTPSEQKSFIKEQEDTIRESVAIAPFIYLSDGFNFQPGSEVYDSEDVLMMDISTSLEDIWPVMPNPRDRAKAIYIPYQDTAYFMGGANLNQSTTLNKMESITLSDYSYASLTAMNRGRALFGAADIGDDIYFSGGLTSGHRRGWTQIELVQSPAYMLATGNESSGILIRLVDDAGELVDADVRVDIRGRLRIPEIDNLLAEFLANRAADRVLGGDGSGTATDLPGEGDSTDVGRLIEAQNTIIDPNSDQFQWNAARKLGQEVTLFPVLYTSNEITLQGGIGTTVLKPRSEDPLQEIAKLAEFIDQQLANTPLDSDETFDGDLTREELAALGEVLATVSLPPTIIESGSLRNLYEIETVVTVLDDTYFGQTVSEFDIKVQEIIRSRIEELLTPPESPESSSSSSSVSGGSGSGPSGVPGINFGGRSDLSESECLVLEHTAQPDIPPQNSGGSQSSGPSARNQSGGPGSSGQCLFCDTLLPLKPDRKEQYLNTSVQVYNYFDWIPQVRERAISNLSTPGEIVEMIDVIDHETPFGGSQLFDTLFKTGAILSDDDFSLVKKVIYVCSDNSSNLSLKTRRKTIDEINSIDGDLQVPVVYTVFSTSFPTSVAAFLQRAETGDVVKITEETGGQSSTLVATRFLDSILNLTLGGATGGLGYGVYRRIVTFDELTSITSMTTNFYLPSNTQGYIRFRYSTDGFNYGDFTERFEGSGYTDFVDFFAKAINFEIVLTTGFTESESEEYAATGIPKLLSIVFDTSGEREDYIYLNKEDVLTNAQQVAVAFEGSVPSAALVDVGVASSASHDWRDFSSPAQPSVREYGKIFLLDRTDDDDSIVPIEPLTTKDQRLYTSEYGPWNPNASVRVYEVVDEGEVEVLGGFKLYPRDGQVLFSTRQDPEKTFKITVVNDDELRVGVRLRNRLHTDSIGVEGVGYIYSTNDEKPPEFSQVAPRAANVTISPSVPNAGDTIFVLYTFIDLNNDKEDGTVISWFKNGKQLLEIQNRTSWDNSNLLAINKIQPNDKIYCTVIPSDGRDFGSTEISPTVKVAAQEPGVSGLSLIPTRSGIINARFDTSSTLTADYEFETDDEGSAALQSGTIISWYLNGTLFKSGTYTEIVDPNISKEELQDLQDANEFATVLKPEEIIGGVSAHEIGNQIYVEVTPKTLLITGSTVRSSTITIENSLPILTNINVQPEFPTTQSTLVLSYTIDDVDILKSIQTDQTEIRWFRSINGTEFIEQESLRDSTTVPNTATSRGDYWRVELTPFDGLEVGSVITTAAKIIQ